MIKMLECFAGTGSAGKVAKELGWEVLSIDIDGRADITMDILEWDYKKYPVGYFDVIWCSPPCATYSHLQYSWIGRERKGEMVTRETIERRMTEIGDPLAKKSLEIIDYFKPYLWFIENPNSSRLKDRPFMKDLPYYVVDYCMYSDWGYKKRTRIWTNKKDWNALTCDGSGACGNMIEKIHHQNLGNTYRNNKAKRFRAQHKTDVSYQGGSGSLSLDMRYRIPPDLIFSLLTE